MQLDKFSFLNNANPEYIESLYDDYANDPDTLDKEWQRFFEGYEFYKKSPGGHITEVSNKEIAVAKLIHGYRSRGHLIARTNPVRERRTHKSDLALDYFGLTDSDLNKQFEAGKEVSLGRSTLSSILERLKKTYCGSIGVEFTYCRNEHLRQWLYQAMEPIDNQPNFSQNEKHHILKKINEAVTFENFLQTKFVGKKRFSLEGLESLIPALDSAVELAAENGAEEIVIGMAHRGRLNVLANIFGKTYEEFFSEFEGTHVPDDLAGDGDVKYHLGRSSDIVTKGGKSIHLSLLPNPSHLEAVNPVLQGIVHAKKDTVYKGDASKIVPIIIHGDSAIAGQGVNYEVLNFSKLDGYGNEGTIHIVTNNQIGFTTNYLEARSSVYCTDIAKVSESPVFHVNADDPEAVVHAVRLAVQIRQQFKIDVYIDILGYRRYGHNEGDEPRFTQPMLYKTIDKHPNIYELYVQKLLDKNIIQPTEVDAMNTKLKAELQDKLELARREKPKLKTDIFKRNWTGLRVCGASDFLGSIDTSVKKTVLDKVAKSLLTFPKDFHLNPKLKRLQSAREKMLKEEQSADWALGELLAYGTLLDEGYRVRLSGQDCQRGTFSHRHAVFKDFENEVQYAPLSALSKEAKDFQVFNSLLSEYGVLGFEHGYSLAAPKTLTMWEAQFGDFSNGAQIIIDQFISSSASKWQRYSGLTMLLPHGYEGQGPEHSSARPERYLQLCAENNMYVVIPTTPSNLFHMLRRQMRNEFRIPLVVMTPKSLLRHPLVKSPLSEFENGRFQEVIDDTIPAKGVKRVVLCTGKIYYDLLERREETKQNDVALVRVEQLYPVPELKLAEIQKKYKSAKEWVWVQEEPVNMGAWSFVLRKYTMFNGLKVVGRKESASPAVGDEKSHKKSQDDILNRAFTL